MEKLSSASQGLASKLDIYSMHGLDLGFPMTQSETDNGQDNAKSLKYELRRGQVAIIVAYATACLQPMHRHIPTVNLL